MARKYISVEVDVNLDDFDPDDIIDYLQDCGYTVLTKEEVKDSPFQVTIPGNSLYSKILAEKMMDILTYKGMQKVLEVIENIE